LIWQHGRLTLRLEAAVGREQALAIAGASADATENRVTLFGDSSTPDAACTATAAACTTSRGHPPTGR
jgi:hypothetical protein